MSNKKSKHPIRNYFVEGLLVLLPLSLTAYLIYFLIKQAARLLSFATKFLPADWQNIGYINVLIDIGAIIAIFLLILLIGLLAKTFIGKGIGKIIGWIINRVPGINFLYKSLRQLFKTFFSFQEADRFSRSILIQYPHKGIWSIAFLTGEAPKTISPDKKKEYYTVFMPSTPNPTTGFMMIIPKKDVILLDIPIEEAIKILMSGGLIKK